MEPPGLATKDDLISLGRDLAKATQSGVMDWIRKAKRRFHILEGVVEAWIGLTQAGVDDDSPGPTPDQETVEELLDRAPPTADEAGEGEPPRDDDD